LPRAGAKSLKIGWLLSIWLALKSFLI